MDMKEKRKESIKVWIPDTALNHRDLYDAGKLLYLSGLKFPQLFSEVFD